MAINTYKVKVIENIKVTKDVHLIRLEKPEDFEFNAGQYISISVMINNQKIKRPYSISSNPKENLIEICVKRIENGPASNYLCDLKKNDEVEFLGPMGKFTLVNKNISGKDKILFISTGTGIGPFISMVYESINKNHEGEIKLLTGFRNKEDILYRDNFENGVERITCLSQEGDKKYVQYYLDESVKKFDKIYICGLKDMINSVKDKLKELEFPEEQIFSEEYD